MAETKTEARPEAETGAGAGGRNLTVRFEDEHRELVEEAAKDCGLSLGAFVRSAAIEKARRVRAEASPVAAEPRT